MFHSPYPFFLCILLDPITLKRYLSSLSRQHVSLMSFIRAGWDGPTRFHGTGSPLPTEDAPVSHPVRAWAAPSGRQLNTQSPRWDHKGSDCEEPSSMVSLSPGSGAAEGTPFFWPPPAFVCANAAVVLHLSSSPFPDVGHTAL